MKYLLWYVVVGVIVIGAHYVVNRRKNSDESENGLNFELYSSPKNRSLFDVISDKVIFPIVGCSIVILGWPFWIAFEIKQKFQSSANTSEPVKEFEIQMHDLIDQHTVDEIEANEIIYDPMGAVPNLPFGHLNSVWVKFLTNVELGDILWKFSANWTTDWGYKELRTGYVILRGDTIGSYFLQSIIDIE